MKPAQWLEGERDKLAEARANGQDLAPTYAMSYPQMGAQARDLNVEELAWVIDTLREAMRVEDQFGGVSDGPEVLAAIARAAAIQAPMLADCEAALEAKSEDGA